MKQMCNMNYETWYKKSVILKSPFSLNFCDCVNIKKNIFGQKQLKIIKMAKKHSKIYFCCAQNINYG